MDYNNLLHEFTQKELNSEVWKDVIGYDYQYQISNLGRFKRVTAYTKRHTGFITRGVFDKFGYLRVNVVENKKAKTLKVHRIVTYHFLNNYSEDLSVNHKNFNKSDNRIENLEMMTYSENALDFILKVKKEKSYSNILGVGYHSQLGKWTTRVNKNGKRVSLGTYSTKEEAEKVILDYQNGIHKDEKVGKGVSNMGIRKYNDSEIEELKKSIETSGYRKTMKIYNVGSSTLISIKKGIYNERRN
jgi:hypothetical protein